MIGHVYQTEPEALRGVAIIDAARGPTETLRDPSGRDRVAPTKVWAHPIPLRDGTFCVPWKPRLNRYEGLPVVVESAPATVPLVRDARDVTDLRELSAAPPETVKR